MSDSLINLSIIIIIIIMLREFDSLSLCVSIKY